MLSTRAYSLILDPFPRLTCLYPPLLLAFTRGSYWRRGFHGGAQNPWLTIERFCADGLVCGELGPQTPNGCIRGATCGHPRARRLHPERNHRNGTGRCSGASPPPIIPQSPAIPSVWCPECDHSQVLVVSAAPGELEAGLGPGGQTKDRAVLAHTLGAKRVIVAVSKMDATEPPFSQKRFEQAKKEVAAALKSGGIDPKTVAFLPISGLKGDNVYTAAGRCTWWEGWSAEPKSGPISGMSLLNAINAMVTPKRSEGALRVPIDRVRELKGVGSVASGRVEAGVLKVGQTVQVAPGNLTAEVKSIERSNTRAQSATVGEIVGFCLDLPPVRTPSSPLPSVGSGWSRLNLCCCGKR